MEKTKQIAQKILCVAVVLMLLSMIASSVVQTSSGQVTVKQLSIETDGGWMLSANLYLPKTATAENPAPGIV